MYPTLLKIGKKPAILNITNKLTCLEQYIFLFSNDYGRHFPAFPACCNIVIMMENKHAFKILKNEHSKDFKCNQFPNDFDVQRRRLPRQRHERPIFGPYSAPPSLPHQEFDHRHFQPPSPGQRHRIALEKFELLCTRNHSLHSDVYWSLFDFRCVCRIAHQGF